MKIWKRIVLAVLAIAILASFAACQVSKAPAETEKSTKPAKTTKQTTKTTTTETTTKEASTTTFAADTAATEPAATEPVEQPMPEEGNTQSTGAAIGEMLQARFENIPEIELPEIALDELYETVLGEAFLGTTTELLLEGSLYVDGVEDIFAEMLADFSSYITIETQTDTLYFSLEQDFPSIENSKFFIEALEMDDELYLSLPDYFGSIISLPLSEMIPPEYTDFNGNAQLADDMMANLSQSTSEVANTFITLLGDSLNAMFSALPDDCISQWETTVDLDTETVDATAVTIHLPPQNQPLVVAAWLDAIPRSASFLPFCEAFYAMAEATNAEIPYRSAQEFADEFADEIADAVEELHDVEYTEGPSIDLDLIFDDDRIYELNITLYAETGESIYFNYANYLTETDGAFWIRILAGDNHTLYGSLELYFGFTDSGEFKTSIDLELSEEIADEAIDLSFNVWTSAQDGNPQADVYGELLLGEDNMFIIDCETWTESDGDDVYCYVQIPEVTVVVDGYTVIDGALYVTALTYENEEVYTYTVDDAIPLEELANSEELLNELAEGLCQNPILAILAEGMY